jgi:hypothetical protein
MALRRSRSRRRRRRRRPERPLEVQRIDRPMDVGRRIQSGEHAGRLRHSGRPLGGQHPGAGPVPPPGWIQRAISGSSVATASTTPEVPERSTTCGNSHQRPDPGHGSADRCPSRTQVTTELAQERNTMQSHTHQTSDVVVELPLDRARARTARHVPELPHPTSVQTYSRSGEACASFTASCLPCVDPRANRQWQTAAYVRSR